MNDHRLLATALHLVVALLLGAACSAPIATRVPPTANVTVTSDLTPTPTASVRVEGLSDEEVATLSSLQQVDDYPLYTMRYYGAYATASNADALYALSTNPENSHPAWACSLFATLGDAGNMLYGRNFDWDYSPALLLFTDPPDGYASASMVDIAYLGLGSRMDRLAELPLSERRALLTAPLLPFDGMNEHGLAVGMAAVPESPVPRDPAKESIGSLRVIREMLDHARNVDEAVAVLDSYNIEWIGGPALHYLIADASGRAVLIEFSTGERVILPNQAPWHHATNFLRAAAGTTTAGMCWRYDRIEQRLTEAQGRLSIQEAMDLLSDVAQPSTQWSVVYGITAGSVTVAMGRGYDQLYAFPLNAAASQ